MNLLFGLAMPLLLIIVAFLVAAMAFSRMYVRSTREVSLVKTGTGGRQVDHRRGHFGDPGAA